VYDSDFPYVEGDEVAYSEQQRDAVYRIWAFAANRNSVLTAQMVNEDADLAVLGISGVTDRTIRNWVDEFDWEYKANEELYKLAPDLRSSAQATLALAAPEASAVLRRVMAMNWEREIPVLHKGEPVLLDDGSVMTYKLLDKDVLKAVVQAAQLVLDRTGFSPVGTREIGGMDAPRTVIEAGSGGDLKGLTPEQLAQREEEAKRTFRLGAMQIGIGQGRKAG
jgi:hypothetical protein